MYRIPALNILKNIDNEMNDFNNYISNIDCDRKIVGLINYTKKNNKSTRINRGGLNRTEKEILSSFNQRKIKERPSLNTLENDTKELGYCGTGRKYNVSDNCIRKWIKNYKLGNAI